MLMILCPCLAPAQSGCINLIWTAPGDDGSAGRAAIYDIRYFTEPITEENWESAWKVLQPPSPQRAGTIQKHALEVIDDDIYFVAMKAADEVLNWSPISNVVQRQPLMDTCLGVVGNVDCDLDQQVNVADLTALATHIFNTDSAPCICFQEADVDFSANGEINVADLMYLLKFLFFGTGYLSSCP